MDVAFETEAVSSKMTVAFADDDDYFYLRQSYVGLVIDDRSDSTSHSLNRCLGEVYFGDERFCRRAAASNSFSRW